MNIEFRFLQKAIEDKNYINFIYKNRHLKKIIPLKLLQKEDKYYLQTSHELFEMHSIKKIQILKKKFTMH